MALDPRPFIKPDAFSHMWGVLAVAAEFRCSVSRIVQAASAAAQLGSHHSSSGSSLLDATTRDGLTSHLSRLGFCIVVVPTDAGFGGGSPYSRGAASSAAHAHARQTAGAGFELHVFASGYERQRSVPAPIPIFCLMSITMALLPPLPAGSRRPGRQGVIDAKGQETQGGDGGGGSGVYELTCRVKCTQKQRAAAFIAELSLGDVFNLLS